MFQTAQVTSSTGTPKTDFLELWNRSLVTFAPAGVPSDPIQETYLESMVGFGTPRPVEFTFAALPTNRSPIPQAEIGSHHLMMDTTIQQLGRDSEAEMLDEGGLGDDRTWWQ